MSGVSIEQRPGLGNVLVATHCFKPGAAVVQERPLLHVPQLKPSNPLFKPCQDYFQQHSVPPSVVLKLMAFVTASPSTQASVLRCFCPDPTAHADAAVVQQARAFATCLLQHPPAPEFAEWADSQQAGQADLEARSAAADTAATGAGPSADAAQQRVQQQHAQAFDVLVRVWLIWVMNGHSFKLGSALFEFGSKLTHTCAGPNTMYRTASGVIATVVESVDGGSSASGGSTLQQQPPALGAGGVGSSSGEASAAGAHLALQHISAGELLTTNYLGMGHKRLVSTPARQQYLQDKFLFKCACHRCTQEVDLACGIPCPSCSGPLRADDRLLQEQEALPEWSIGQSLSSSSSSSSSSGGSSGGGGGGVDEEGRRGADADAGASSSSGRCGYIYCDMAAKLAGACKPWKCDQCGATVADDTAELWGRFYTKSHASIEADVEGWVMRLDVSLDTAPLVRDPSVLHQRVLGVVRLLGPRHWAAWRLLLLGVELHCGALEEAALRAQLQQRRAERAAAQGAPAAGATAVGSAAEAPSAGTQTAEQQPPAGSAAEDPQRAQASAAAAANLTQLAVWVVRYCRQLWAAVGAKYGPVEAGQALGHHFSEAAQVLLQVASSSALLPQETAHGLVDAALQLQLLVLPGLRSIMGPGYNPLAQLLGPDSLEAGVGVAGGVDAAAVAAAVRRQQQQQAAEASQMMSLVRELRQLEAKEAGPQ